MKKNTRLSKRMLSIFLCVAMLLTYLPTMFLTASATEVYKYKGNAGNKISDPDTSAKYSEFLGDNASTEYSGRIWTDKSVYTDDAAFDIFGGGKSTIKLNENENGEDFLIAYSALATAKSVSGQTKAPVDVVFILDISGSMSNGDSNMNNGKSRIYNTVQATNNAIDELMTLNPYTRVAVAAFSSNAQVLLPLGRYTKKATDVPYFTLNRNTGSDVYETTLYTNAVNSFGAKIKDSTRVEGGTNIQMGLYKGMKVLADVDKQDTKVNINGQTVQRVPLVVMLSDGSPTFSSDSKSWWAPSDNYNDGPGNEAYAGNGMKAILVGSYMKDAIDRNYEVTDTAFAAKVYTVGMGITSLKGAEKQLANMTLDPGTYWNDNNITNSMKTTIKNYWGKYTSGNNSGKLNINVGQQGENGINEDKDYYLTHPKTGYDVDPVNGYDYVDKYYGADKASAITKVFNEIVSNIAISAPQVPTEIKGTDPVTDGYIIYTDPIGEYMEVKDVKAVIYADRTFTAKNTVTNGDTTTYTFTGTVNSSLYGKQDIKNILIIVDETDGKQTLIVKIPASLIPLRVNEVTLNSDGSVKAHKNNGVMPARVIYSVGLQSEIARETDNGTVYIDKSKISAEYLTANADNDGAIRFYSNEYTNSQPINGSTVGDATVEFEPSHTNSFYYLLDDMPIYKDAGFKDQVTEGERLDDNTVYYYKDEYYYGNAVKVTATALTGAQLKATEIKKGTDGCLYSAAGSVRLNRILSPEGSKVLNKTQTAEDFYAPEFKYADGISDAYNGKLVVHLGNNGVLAIAAGGNLQISKTVNAGAGLTAPDKTFEFTIDLDGDKESGGTYDYAIVDAAGKTVAAGTVSASSKTIRLKDGQTATVYGLPPESAYIVTEAAVNGFTCVSEGATGLIKAGQTSVASFTNTYNVAPVVWPANNELKGTKKLVGRDWTENDSFTFFITPCNNEPLPENYDKDKGVTVNKPDSKNTAIFNFGQIKFTAPGVYSYTIGEKEPEGNAYLPGMSYSKALYRVVVTVKDNGDGTLKVVSSDIQRLYDENANPLFTYDNGKIVMNSGEEGQDAIQFTNTYAPAPATVEFPLINKVIDGDRSEPLKAGEFSFEMKVVSANPADGIKLPSTTVVTNAENGNITFGEITFTKAGTYTVAVQEIIPESAHKAAGITYSTEKITAVYSVVDNCNGALTATLTQLTGGENIINRYTAKPANVTIDITKTLTGRRNEEWLATDKFDFAVRAVGSDTLASIQNGDIEFAFESGNTDSATYTVSSPRDKASAAVKVNKPGTYRFIVSEVDGGIKGITYDKSEKEIVIVATDDSANAQIKVKVNGQDTNRATVHFTNRYKSEATSPVTITAKKKVTASEGNSYTMKGGEFSFIIEGTPGAPMPDNTTVKNDAQGNVNFGKVQFTERGTYVYTIREVKGDLEGFLYDGEVYTMSVAVTDDYTTGKLVAAAKITDKAGKEAKIEFNNKYNPKETSAIISGLKELEGRRLNADEFIFAVLDSENKEVALAKNNHNGGFKFTLRFTKAGTYNYKIAEKNNEVAGVTYDKKIYGVEIVITDKGGHLEADSVDYTLDGKAVEKIIFTNKYEAAQTDITVSAIKKLTGRNLNDGEFKFVLKDKEGNIITTATNTKDGKVVFDKIVFTEAGTYTYTVFEETGTVEHVTYDKTEYVVKVTVADQGKGKLVASDPVFMKAGSNDAVTQIVFENTYTDPTPPDVPHSPKTGDSANLWLWSALLFVSGAGVIGTTVCSKKKKRSAR